MTLPTSNGNLQRRFWRLSALNVLANITVPLAGLVDTAILGHLDDLRFLAGVALGAVVFDYVFWTFGFLRMATTGVTAQAVGRRDAEGIERIFRRSAALALGAGLAILALRVPLGDLAFHLLSGDAGTEAAGRAYFDARILGAPATLLGFVFLGWFLGREESRVALWIAVVANAANIGLDVLFILGFGWGARGAGLATAASQYLALAVAVAFYWRRRGAFPWLSIAVWRRFLGGEGWGSLFGLQRDILLRTLALTTTFALFTDASARLGTEVLAANALLLRIVTLSAFLVDGAAFAVESLAGIFWGAGDRTALRRLLRLALGAGLWASAVVAAVAIAFPGAVLGLLTSHTDVIALGTELRFWLLPVLVCGSIAYIYDGLFLGLTAGRTLRNAMAIAFVLFAVPAWYAVERGDVHLLWAALLAFLVARSLVLGAAARRLFARSEAAA